MSISQPTLADIWELFRETDPKMQETSLQMKETALQKAAGKAQAPTASLRQQARDGHGVA